MKALMCVAAALSCSLLLPVGSLAQTGSGETVKSLLTQPSMNAFRRFTVDRAKMMEFYGEVLALRPMPAINMPGGGQMSRFQVGTAEIVVDARANAWNVKITQPLGNFSAALRTIWLADPDGITNYFAQVTPRESR